MLNSTRSKPEPYTMLLEISFQAESLRRYHHGVSVTELILLHLADKAITTALVKHTLGYAYVQV